MNIATILPHTLLYGGVKQYLEIGETFIDRGHQFSIFTPEGKPPDWTCFRGKVLPLDQFQNHRLDALFTSEECFLDYLVASTAPTRIFYVINKNKALKRIVRHKDILFFANATSSVQRIYRKLGIHAFKAFCGVNTNDFFPRDTTIPQRPFTIVTYGRQAMGRKGTDLVVGACEILYKKGYQIQLVLFDTVTSPASADAITGFSTTVPFKFIVNHPVAKNYELYHNAHVFVSAERKGTWANTASEAMACKTPVICSRVGSDDFVIPGKTGLLVSHNPGSIARAIAKLYHNPELCTTLARNGVPLVRRFQWRITADRILTLLERHDIKEVSHTEWPHSVNSQKNVPASRLNKFSRKQASPVMPGVYIINYLDIVDPTSSEPWQKHFGKYCTALPNFMAQLEFLGSHAKAIRLDEVQRSIASARDRAFFAVTFDGGYRSVYRHGLPLCKKLNILPTICINPAFIESASVFVGVGLAHLAATKRYRQVRNELAQKHAIALPRNFDTLDANVYRVFDGAALQCVDTILGRDRPENTTMSWRNLRELVQNGWAVGNHTTHHERLKNMSVEDQAERIENATKAIQENGITPAPFLSIPFGTGTDADGGTLLWLSQHPDWHGLFTTGGVNRHFYRTELLRINAGNSTGGQLRLKLYKASMVTGL